MFEHRLTHARTALRATLGAALAAGAVAGGVAAGTAAHADADVRPPAQAAHVAQAGANGEAGERTQAVKVTAAQVLATARAQIGTTENADGGGTKFQDWYATSQRGAETAARDGGNITSYKNAPWCSMFVSWVGEHTGARSQIGWDAYTVTHAKWFEANHRFGTEAKPGAVVFFSWSGSKSLSAINHVGFVVKDNGDGTISTIEGNTGNGKVEQRTRPTSQVVGYGYPTYAS
ncbi:CHAP domain-containing protein [Nonomuraea sp. LP-02]|uniref:CHAP domain-containing protein n=1 Tax=Nonomuraea sp. LP-02 TaxID=3097960 RepID=UPI002E2F4A07|nr:CHAP domain-containing protein [Nonomuraea sp. LP-02]MED7925107.1 CHAP domain-containing protein [Nonomuraea sp. LP-02]